MSLPDPREQLRAKVAALRAGRSVNHVGAVLVSAGRVTWFACPRCKKLLDREGWAAPCEPKETSA